MIKVRRCSRYGYYLMVTFVVLNWISLSGSFAQTEKETTFFGLLQQKAESAKQPALVTRNALEKSLSERDMLSLTNGYIVWSVISGYQVAHLPNEDLRTFQEVAQNNEKILLSLIKSELSPYSLQIGVDADSSKRVAGQLSVECNVRLEQGALIQNQMSFVSGIALPSADACRLFAWAFAASGIKFSERNRALTMMPLRP